MADEGIPEYEPLTPELVEEEAIRGDFVLKWAVVLLAFLLGCTRIGETATLVHVKSGQYLASHGFLPPRTDVLSYTAAEHPWVNLSWGFDLLVAGAYAVGGFAGLSLLKAALAAVTFAFLVQIYRPALPTWWGSVCAATALLAVHLRLTAQPALITLLGTAVVLWLLHSWRQLDYERKRVLWLVPVFLLWSNLDPRMYVGLTLVFLYVAGDSLDALLKRSIAMPAAARKQLWQVFAACLVAAMINPFGWKSLAAPLAIYGAENPAFRSYVAGSPSGPSLLYFPITTPEFWSNLDTASVAALLLIVAAGLLLAWNWSRVELAHVAVFCGFVYLAAMSLHELAVAALVCCVVAALNGQTWYAAHCRLTYSVTTQELLFSRGGRAVTVLAFAALAFLDIAGRLRDSFAPRTGFGLDANLAATVDGLREQLQDSHGRTFNFRPEQGDLLIWLGREPFVDSRLAVYRGGGAEDLLALHAKTRDALRIRKSAAQRKPVADLNRDRAVWRSVFDTYGVTHVLPRLTMGRTAPDYFTLFDLLEANRDWQLTSFGAVTAVFYRTDKPEDAELTRFREQHKVDFTAAAFKTKGPLATARDHWVSAPSFYDKYLWARRRNIPNEVQEAMHLVRMASDGQLPAWLGTQRLALAGLGIRRAQAGLAKFADSTEGYLALGIGYSLLSRWEAEFTLNSRGPQQSALRYFQAAAAYGQALRGDPANETAHVGAFALYETAGKVDLALRERAFLNELLSRRPAETVDEVTAQQQAFRMQEQLEKMVATVDEELQQIAERGASSLQLAQYAAERGCILKALHHLTKDAEALKGSLEAQRMQVVFLLEAGQAEEADEAARMMEEPAKQAGLSKWREAVALASLANADYDRAIQLWNEAAAEMEQSAFTRILFAAPPRVSGGNQPLPWPLSITNSALDYLYLRPDGVAALKLSVALVQLERGQFDEAAKTFRTVLEIDPEISSRPLVAYYLQLLTGADIDFLPPSESIPILFEPEPEN